MYSLEGNILTRRFSKTSLTDYPDQETYANLPDDTEGKLMPVMLGTLDTGGASVLQRFLKGVPCILVDVGTDQGLGTWRARKFKICEDIKNPETGTFHALNSNGAVIKYEGQIATLLTGGGTNYNLSDNNTQIDFINAAAGDLKEDTQIRVDDFNILDDASGTFTGTGSLPIGINGAQDIIHFLLVCKAGVPTSKIDIASFTFNGLTKQGISGTMRIPSWALAANPALGSADLQSFAYFADQSTVKEIIDIMAFSMGHYVAIDNNGKFTLRRIENLTTVNDVIIVDADISGWKEKLSLDSFINRVVVQWGQIPAGSQSIEGYSDTGKKKRRRKRKQNKLEFLETQAFNVVRNALTQVVGSTNVINDFPRTLTGKEIEFVVPTYLWTSSFAQVLANELFRMWCRGVWQASFDNIDGSLISVIPGDRIVVHRQRSSNSTQTKLGKAYRLIDATREYANNTATVNRVDEVK